MFVNTESDLELKFLFGLHVQASLLLWEMNWSYRRSLDFVHYGERSCSLGSLNLLGNEHITDGEMTASAK